MYEDEPIAHLLLARRRRLPVGQEPPVQLFLMQVVDSAHAPSKCPTNCSADIDAIGLAIGERTTLVWLFPAA